MELHSQLTDEKGYCKTKLFCELRICLIEPSVGYSPILSNALYIILYYIILYMTKTEPRPQ